MSIDRQGAMWAYALGSKGVWFAAPRGAKKGIPIFNEKSRQHLHYWKQGLNGHDFLYQG